MLNFGSDYIAGAHPEVLQHLVETNLVNTTGYGTDEYCSIAREKIAAACGKAVDVQFLVGGTQTNQVVISTMLEGYEGVVAATTGHVSVHEAGAIEYSGHKVLQIPGKEGKVVIPSLVEYLEGFYGDDNHEHMVFPGMLYISHPTEYGTLYTKAELEELRSICTRFKMRLFVDGARLGYGLMAKETDVTMEDLAQLCDVFYIGGTKVGALCGEALVFCKDNTPKHFVNLIKKRGALLAKGRLLGVQFDALFTNDLYYRIGKHAIDMAEQLKIMFKAKGYQFFLDSPTNQQFVVLENNKLKELEKNVIMGFWEKYDDNHTVMRFATSWSTTQEDIDALEKLL